MSELPSTPSVWTFGWDEALREFLLHVEATRAQKTHRFYRIQLSGLAHWAQENQIPFEGFGKRHLDRFLVYRQNEGKAALTVHHDAVCAKCFFAWCAKNDLLDRSPLAEYRVRSAPRPPKHMPTDDEMRKLLAVVPDFWNPVKNPAARYFAPAKRAFHRDRNRCILIGLLDSACRIGEVLSLKVNDWSSGARQITIRESKGREPRVIPVSPEWAKALEDWCRTRARVMSGVPKNEDEGWLFLSETGTRLEERRFLKNLKDYLAFAGLPSEISLHSLRRYSINRLAKVNLLAAQSIAGHKSPETTLIYTKLDGEFVRGVHDSVGVVRTVLSSKREPLQRAVRRRLV